MDASEEIKDRILQFPFFFSFLTLLKIQRGAVELCLRHRDPERAHQSCSQYNNTN